MRSSSPSLVAGLALLLLVVPAVTQAAGVLTLDKEGIAVLSWSGPPAARAPLTTGFAKLDAPSTPQVVTVTRAAATPAPQLEQAFAAKKKFASATLRIAGSGGAEETWVLTNVIVRKVVRAGDKETVTLEVTAAKKTAAAPLAAPAPVAAPSPFKSPLRTTTAPPPPPPAKAGVAVPPPPPPPGVAPAGAPAEPGKVEGENQEKKDAPPGLEKKGGTPPGQDKDKEKTSKEKDSKGKDKDKKVKGEGEEEEGEEADEETEEVEKGKK